MLRVHSIHVIPSKARNLPKDSGITLWAQPITSFVGEAPRFAQDDHLRTWVVKFPTASGSATEFCNPF
jgi:hypothetical protein